MRMNVLGLGVSSLFLVVSALSGVCHGQLVPAAGPGTSEYRIEHGTAVDDGPSAVALFWPVGGLKSPGGGYPTLGPTTASNFIIGGLTPNLPVTLNTPAAGVVPGIIGASSSITGVAGFGRAGILALPLPALNVGVVPNGRIAFNAFGGTADYVNAGGPFVANIASFMNGTLSVGGGAGDFAAASVRFLVQIGTGVGPNFVPTTSFFLADIVARFDGVGVARPLPDDVSANFFVNAFPNDNTMTFSALSTGVIAMNPGATLRITGTGTIIGDPMTYVGGDILDPSVASNLPDDFVGYGSSRDAATIFGAAGACCRPNNVCTTDVTSDACVKLGGRYLGDGSTSCAHDAAGDCIPTVSEWGLVVMAILVLSAATVVIMRRRAMVRG